MADPIPAASFVYGANQRDAALVTCSHDCPDACTFAFQSGQPKTNVIARPDLAPVGVVMFVARYVITSKGFMVVTARGCTLRS